jgi:hypothetical protein
MGLFSAAEVRRSARRAAVLVELGLDESLVMDPSPDSGTGVTALIPLPRAAVDDLIESSAPAPDLRRALVPWPAPVVTPEVLPDVAHPGLMRRLLAESGGLVLAGVLTIEWAAGAFH